MAKTESKLVHCLCTASGKFIFDGVEHRKGDPLTVTREVFDQYNGSHLQFIEDVPDEKPKRKAEEPQLIEEPEPTEVEK